MSNRAVSFIGAKGGSGASTLCVEVSRQLAKCGSVALIDADLSGRRSIAVLLDAVRTFDGLRLEDAPPIALVEGIEVAELVQTLVSSFSLRAEIVQHIAEQVLQKDIVIVDAPQPYAGALRPLMSITAKYLIVMEPTMLGTTGARALIADHLRAVSQHRTAVVLQRRDQRKP
ncbi:MAG: ParA family protein, partial [Candidatus Eremiobacteraeota bacterium]|nr:ParA family protein [Candidatus Eremiobacteraeota bacterium]